MTATIHTTAIELRAALGAVAGAVNRGTLPILGNVRLVSDGERMRCTTTDLEVQITSSCALEQADACDLTVDHRKLAAIVASLHKQAPVRIVADGNRLQISSGRSRFTLETLPSEQFPDLEPIAHQLSLTADAARLASQLSGVASAQGRGDVRHYLNGTCLDILDGQLTLVATDGHRLHHSGVAAEISGKLTRSPILSLRVADLIARACGQCEPEARVELLLSPGSVQLTTDHIDLRGRLIDGQYPDWRRIIPRLADRFLCCPVALRGAIQQALLVQPQNDAVWISSANDAIGITSQGDDGETAIQIDALTGNSRGEDESGRIFINGRYLLQALDHRTGQVQCRYSDEQTALIITGGDTDITAIVMAMRS